MRLFIGTGLLAVFLLATTALAGEHLHPYSITDSQVWGDIYFGTLSAELDDPAMTTIEELADWLKEHPGSSVMLAGYDDQRTRAEASVELGWARVNAVRDYLVSLGVDGGAIQSISFGNTRVALPGEGEEVWAKNRRVRYRVVPPEDPERTEGRPSGVCQKCKR